MTRRAPLVLTAVAALALAVVLLAAVLGSGGSDDGALPTTTAPGAPAPGAGATPSAGTSLAEAMAQDQTPLGAVEAGEVVASGVPRDPNPAPAGVVTESDGAVVGANGCLVGYGDGGECLPAVPQSAAEMGMTRQQMPWQCEEVNLIFRDGLAVAAGQDVLGLDSNADGTACGAGDAPGRAGSHAHG